MKNILKVLKTSFSYATDVVGFVKENPALKVRIPKYDILEEDPAHIFSKEEIKMILERFENNHAFYYAILTAYYTGLRVSEVFGLTWNDIDIDFDIDKIRKNKIELLDCQIDLILRSLEFYAYTYQFIYPRRHKSESKEENLRICLVRDSYEQILNQFGISKKQNPIDNENDEFGNIFKIA